MLPDIDALANLQAEVIEQAFFLLTVVEGIHPLAFLAQGHIHELVFLIVIESAIVLVGYDDITPF